MRQSITVSTHNAKVLNTPQQSNQSLSYLYFFNLFSGDKAGKDKHGEFGYYDLQLGLINGKIHCILREGENAIEYYPFIMGRSMGRSRGRSRGFAKGAAKIKDGSIDLFKLEGK